MKSGSNMSYTQLLQNGNTNHEHNSRDVLLLAYMARYVVSFWVKEAICDFWHVFCQFNSQTHIHTPYMIPSHHSHSWYEYSPPSQGKMQFSIHLVTFGLDWNVAPFQTKWEIPFVPFFSDLWIFGRPAAFNHKDADEIDLDTDYPHPYLQQWIVMKWNILDCCYWYQRDYLEQPLQ